MQLPSYLEGFLPLEKLPYLADVARLELARIACFHAADSATLSAEDFTSLSIDALLSASFVLNPSLRFVVLNIRFSSFGIAKFTIVEFPSLPIGRAKKCFACVEKTPSSHSNYSSVGQYF